MSIEAGQVYRLKESTKATLWKPLFIKVTWVGSGWFKHNLNGVTWRHGLIIHNYILDD